jgi:hypothetical protein
MLINPPDADITIQLPTAGDAEFDDMVLHDRMKRWFINHFSQEFDRLYSKEWVTGTHEMSYMPYGIPEIAPIPEEHR